MSQPQSPPPDDEIEVDGVQEEDAERTHPVLAAALLLLLLNAPGPGAPSLHRDWYGLVEASLGTAITSYLVRSAFDLLRVAPHAVRAVDHPAVVQPVVDRLVPAVARQTARSLATAAPHLHASTDRSRDSRDSAARIGYAIAVGGREQVRDAVARQIGATGKTWRTRRDARVRGTHASMEGQTRPIGQPFDAGNGMTIRFPQDPEAPLSLTAMCRCHTAYRIPRSIT